jgi:hypothetical protein
LDQSGEAVHAASLETARRADQPDFCRAARLGIKQEHCIGELPSEKCSAAACWLTALSVARSIETSTNERGGFQDDTVAVRNAAITNP